MMVLFIILTTCRELEKMPFYFSYNIRIAITFPDLTGKKILPTDGKRGVFKQGAVTDKHELIFNILLIH